MRDRRLQVIALTMALVLGLGWFAMRRSGQVNAPPNSPPPADSARGEPSPASATRQGPPTNPAPPPKTKPAPPALPPESSQEQAEREFTARLDEISALAHEEFGLREALAALHPPSDRNRSDQSFARLREPFDQLAAAAAEGNDRALKILLRSAELPNLRGFAVQALGKPAAAGNEEAISALLDWKARGWLLSGSAGALHEAAAGGDARILDFYRAIADDPKSRPLWFMTALALEPQSRLGNPAAVAALMAMADDAEPNLRDIVLRSLRAAAAAGSQKAAQRLAQTKP